MKEHSFYRGYIISEDGKVFSCLQRNGRNPAKTVTKITKLFA